MHLFKAKATLSDYLDLNRRYIKTTDVVLFEDDTIKFDIVPKHFFKTIADDLYKDTFTVSELLYENCDMARISDCFVVDDSAIVAGINEELGINVTDMQSARAALEDTRYQRLQHLIDTKFTDDKILSLLDCFESRNDDEIRSMVTDNADIPTIFEYVLGILWYKISERHGKILDYMKLSLDADLLPKTHAAGGEADIVYEYEATDCYPEHTLLLEATLADSTNQRRMEMEPVSRHLGMHLIRTSNLNSYCVFATNYLNINVISDFRSRKTTPFYDPQDYSKSIAGMKIIPLQTSELKKIVSNRKTYKELYSLFETAYNSNLPPHEWYNQIYVRFLEAICSKKLFLSRRRIMATSEQLLSLIRAHYENDNERFKTVALQIAAHESKIGHTVLAQSLKDMVMKQKANQIVRSIKPMDNSLITQRISKSRKSDLIVSEKLDRQINNIILEFMQRSKLSRNGYINRRKILLEGLPGTGKTLTASVLATELKLPLYIVQTDKLISKYMGETGTKLRQIFDAISQDIGIYFLMNLIL